MFPFGLSSRGNEKSAADRHRYPFKKIIVAALAATLSLAALPSSRAQAPVIPAIELDGGTGWIGTDRPLTLRELRGKFVILDFWTLC